MKYIILIILVSSITAAIVAKAIAVYHFKVIDSYVEDMVEIAKVEIDKAYTSRDTH